MGRLIIGAFLAGIIATGLISSIRAAADPPRPRARDLGINPGVFPPGPLNAITDVEGVRVGHVTLNQGENIRTGVTAILPHGGNLFQEKVAGAVFVGNAFGKLAGSTQVEELGTIETPIILTNTLSVGTAVEAVVAHTLRSEGQRVGAVGQRAGRRDQRRRAQRHPRPARPARARLGGDRFGQGRTGRRGLRRRRDGHRLLRLEGRDRHVVADPARAVRELPARRPGPDELRRRAHDRRGTGGQGAGPLRIQSGTPTAAHGAAEHASADELSGGSCMIVVATDAPLDARDLKRLAARAIFGLARTGSSYSNGSGDYAIAFTTSTELRSRPGETRPTPRRILPTDAVSPLFQAALEATEEAVYNALFQATTTTGFRTDARGNPHRLGPRHPQASHS